MDLGDCPGPGEARAAGFSRNQTQRTPCSRAARTTECARRRTVETARGRRARPRSAVGRSSEEVGSEWRERKGSLTSYFTGGGERIRTADFYVAKVLGSPATGG